MHPKPRCRPREVQPRQKGRHPGELAWMWGALLATLSLAIAAPAASAQEASHYRSSAQGYSFSYPATWREVTGSIERTAGAALERVLLQAPDGVLAFVSVIQLNRPIRPDELPDLQSELDTAMNRIAAQAGGEVAQGRLVEGGFYYRINFPRDGATVESRQYILFTGDRQFIIALEADAVGQQRHEGVLDLMFSTFAIDAS